MTQVELRSRVRSILASRMGMDPTRIEDETLLMEDLGMDSLDAVQFTLAVETEFDVELLDEQVSAVRTFSELTGLVATSLGDKAA